MPSDGGGGGGGPGPPRPTFTVDDSAFGEAYVGNRALLYQMWTLANAYPGVACKIHVRVRMADPIADYAYDANFTDAALAVALSWTDERAACDYLSCNSTYPIGRACAYGDAPRVFPSGDETTLTACEPACYMLTALERDETRAHFASRECRVMRNNGAYERHVENGPVDAAHSSVVSSAPVDVARSSLASSAPVDAARSNVASFAPVDAARSSVASSAPDMPYLEYSRASSRCELGNAGIVAFVTQPYYRSQTHDVCRQDNFTVGDDLVYTSAGERSGRHSRTYCNAFYKSLDPTTRACETAWWETALSYTFLGSALLRLGRHAVHGDGCGPDSLFKTDAARRETTARDVPAARRSRAAWFTDVNSAWRLPPPNVLLSDLGVERADQVWSNVHGLRETTADDERAFHLGARDERRRARRALQRNAGASRPATTTTTSDSDDRTLRVDYERIYDEIARQTSNERLAEIARTVAEEIGGVAGTVMAQHLLSRVTKRSFNVALRFVCGEFAGRASSTLVAMGVRVAASRIIGATMARLTTRMMLVAATTASGVGAIVGLVELVTIVLDVMLAFGWDPGNYNSEFDNAVYDDMSRAWREQKRLHQATAVDPYVVLALFARSAETDAADERRRRSMTVRRESDAPWFFESFPRAVQALVRDELEEPRRGGEDNARSDDPSARTRPLVSSHSVVCSLLWSMQYFRRRKTNSLGQRMNLEEDALVRLDDSYAEREIRRNETAALLSTRSDARYDDRGALLGMARRNHFARISARARVGALLALGAGAVALAWPVGVALGGGRTRVAAAALAVALTFAPLAIFALALAEPEWSRKSFDRADEDDDRDAVDEICDAIADEIRGAQQDLDPVLMSWLLDAREELRVVYDDREKEEEVEEKEKAGRNRLRIETTVA